SDSQDGSPVADALASLLENRLIARQRSVKPGLEPRLDMLEVIRQYAGDRLAASGDERVVRDRHVRFICKFAEAIEPGLECPVSKEALEAAENDIGNTRAALSWCVDTGSAESGLQLAGTLKAFWFRRGLISEGARWLDKLGVQQAEVSPPVKAKALAAFGL